MFVDVRVMRVARSHSEMSSMRSQYCWRTERSGLGDDPYAAPAFSSRPSRPTNHESTEGTNNTTQSDLSESAEEDTDERSVI